MKSMLTGNSFDISELAELEEENYLPINTKHVLEVDLSSGMLNNQPCLAVFYDDFIMLTVLKGNLRSYYGSVYSTGDAAADRYITYHVSHQPIFISNKNTDYAISSSLNNASINKEAGCVAGTAIFISLLAYIILHFATLPQSMFLFMLCTILTVAMVCLDFIVFSSSKNILLALHCDNNALLLDAPVYCDLFNSQKDNLQLITSFAKDNGDAGGTKQQVIDYFHQEVGNSSFNYRRKRE